MDIDDFKKEVTRVGSHKHIIPHCVGTREAWKYIRRNKWEGIGEPVESSLYSEIINLMNKELVEDMLGGHTVVFPYGIGSMKIVNEPVRIKPDGKNNCLVDWKGTLEWWYSDPSAHSARKVLKRLSKSVVRASFCKGNFTNRRFWLFRFNRDLKRFITKMSDKMRFNAKNI